MCAAAAAPCARLARAAEAASARVPVLAYHRFAPTAADSMTVRMANFESHLRVIQERGCTVIPLADLVAWRLGRLDKLPPRPVVLTADDGHRSVFEAMAPAIERLRWPVTLFIYPSAISNAGYAMTWDQLRQLQAGGLFTIESHTYWHPNFAVEKKRLSPEDFKRFADNQLRRSKLVLEQRMGRPVTLLAWPFGVLDADTMAMAADAGYGAAFELGARPVRRRDPLQALPRHLMVDAIDARRLGRLLDDAFASGEPS